MRRVKSISKELRAELKIKVDCAGRQEVADLTDTRYGTLTDKLNGKLPISEIEYHKFLDACSNLKT